MAEREGIRTLRVELPTAASKLAVALANGDLSTSPTLYRIILGDPVADDDPFDRPLCLRQYRLDGQFNELHLIPRRRNQDVARSCGHAVTSNVLKDTLQWKGKVRESRMDRYPRCVARLPVRVDATKRASEGISGFMNSSTF